MSAQIPIRRALVSVYDKTGLEELGRGLAAAGVQVVSTGSTAAKLRDAGVDVTPVDATPGSEPVRELAESGEPVVVTAPTRAARSPQSPRDNSSRDGSYGARGADSPHRHRRNGRRPQRPRRAA